MRKKSGILKMRKFHIVLLTELFLLIYGIFGMLRGEESLYSLDSMTVTIAGGGVSAGVYSVDGDDDPDEDWLKAYGFSLKPGVYRLVCTYETEENETSAIGIHADSKLFHALLNNDASLYANAGTKSIQFYVTGNLSEELGPEIVITYQGELPLTVTGLEIIKTTGGSSILIFFTLLGSFFIDSLMMLYEYTRKNSLGREWVLVRLSVLAFALISSIPLMVDYMIAGADLSFHLLRIEFLADSLKQGIFPARVESEWLYGHGYASSIFYCDTFLLIPALLRLIALPMNFAYGAYVFLVNLATAVVAYLCFGRMFQSKKVGLLGSMLYTLAPYRLYNIYNRSAVGEYTAMIFLPVVALGFYLLLGREEEKPRKHSLDWLVLVIGFSGIIQSHLLSCEITVAFSALLCLLCIKRVFRKETFLSLLKAVGATLLVNLWFLGPLLDMMLSGEYRYSLNTGNYIQDRGLLLANLLLTRQDAGSNSAFQELGLWDTEPINIGIGMMFAVVVWVLLRRRYREKDRHFDRMALAAFGVGIAAVILSTYYFPWDQLHDLNSLAATLVSMIQFPTRLTVVVTVCMTVISCTAVRWALQSKDRAFRHIFVAVLCGLCVLFSMNQLNDTLFSAEDILRVYAGEEIGHSAVLGAEYLPLGVELGFSYHDATASDDGQVTILEYSKENLDTYTQLTVEEDAEDAWVELPMLYYKGYRAVDVSTGENLSVESGTNGHVRVLLEAGFDGTVHAWYAGMWYWRMFEGISLVTAAGLCIEYLQHKRKRSKAGLSAEA
ncbi:MAG: hypothetical protein LUG61_01625 [Lachnospiraceae bacterium]|nr:hypothetical protein [Lachnospiraceae bacterium]